MQHFFQNGYFSGVRQLYSTLEASESQHVATQDSAYSCMQDGFLKLLKAKSLDAWNYVESQMENIKLNSSLRVTFILTFRTVITIIIISSVKVFVIENANLIPRPLNSALPQQRAISQSRTFEWFLIQPCHPPRSLITVCHQCHHCYRYHHYHHRRHLIDLLHLN